MQIAIKQRACYDLKRSRDCVAGATRKPDVWPGALNRSRQQLLSLHALCYYQFSFRMWHFYE